MGPFKSRETISIVSALKKMNTLVLERCKCWFGGGTEIIMDIGEYRLSSDVDFMCSDAEGYREMRTMAVSGKIGDLIGNDTQIRRPFTSDQYGIRGVIVSDGLPLKVEIVKESRLSLEGRTDGLDGLPRLSASDRVTEKLLANADRGQDRAAAYRDAIDLGMLALFRGPFQQGAFTKAEAAYGKDAVRKLAWVMDKLSDNKERQRAATALRMDSVLIDAAMRALAGEIACLRIEGFPLRDVPAHPRETHLIDVSKDGETIGVRKRTEFPEFPGKLDNPIGPSVVSSGRVAFHTDGVRDNKASEPEIDMLDF